MIITWLPSLFDFEARNPKGLPPIENLKKILKIGTHYPKSKPNDLIEFKK